MPTYHDFDPWRRANENIASGMAAVYSAKNRRAMWEQEQAMNAPLVAARTQALQADAEKTTFDTSDRKRKAALIENMGIQIQQEVQELPDGSTVISPRGKQLLTRMQVEMGTGANDLGLGMLNSAKAFNYLGEQKAERKNKRQMNREDNAAAMDRTMADINAPSKSTPQGESIRMQAKKEEYMLLTRKIADAERTETVLPLMKRRNQLARELGLAESAPAPAATNSAAPANSSLTPPGVSEQGGNTPAAGGKIVIQNGFRYQLSPDGTATPLGPAQ